MTQNTKQLAAQIGRSIARHRQGLGITQDQVAEKLGIGNEAVSRMERGITIPTIARLAELADIFDCGIEELLLDTSHRPQDQAKRINAMLSRLSSQDREMIIETIEKLFTRLVKN
ncbi:helix-turn-helix domain-containing protein [Methylobacillus sp.]|uniref:helix-turn-helix domain-containing protein n=1 Tax=Methylobacillus sp. TaxID=56818 RepID=UPI002FE0F074